MSIEKDIQRLFEDVLRKYDGNKAAAAESLGVNPVTFWHWVTKTRNLPKTLCKAIDSAGAKLLLPGENPATLSVPPQEIDSLLKEIGYLKRENELLQQLVDKYKEDEHVKKEAPENQESYTRRPAPAINIRMDSTPGTGESL